MAYEIRRAIACRRDLEEIFDHLMTSHVNLGSSTAEAFDLAARRLSAIEQEIQTLGRTPHQGTLWPEILPGLRWVTKNRAIFYFRVDDAARRLDLLAIFHGTQDHKAHILTRIAKG